MVTHYETSKYEGNFHKRVDRGAQSASFTLRIDTRKKYQSMLGFGGAFTEAAAYTLSRMSPENRDKVMRAYFDRENGLGYNLGRVSIHSCDFSLKNHTYVDDNDKTLESFSIERDHRWVIPMIEEAGRIRGEKISLLASPWSPPAWMKDNNDMNHGGKLLPEFRQTWADYFVRFLDAYKAAGVDIFGVSVQNEPAAKQIWDSCLYTAEEERDFVKHHLGPTLSRSDHPETKIIIWDHNRDIIVERAETVLNDPKAYQYVWGTGVHWYVSENFGNLSEVKEKFPEKHILFTEGCIEGGPQIGAFETGERYARNMIGDISNHCEGYIDWNLTLNEIGGPNHVGNYCDAPIICDTVNDTVHFNSSYYAIGHFSKHILPGARRIGSVCDAPGLTHVAFVNPDGATITVIQNETEEAHTLRLDKEGTTHNVTIRPRSISTFLL